MQKIFIVEDEKSVVDSLILGLKDEFSVRSVVNFRAVKQEILEFEADLVLMDIGLPFYSGFYWTENLRKVSQIPIIFISSASDDMNQISAMNQGADDFVTKPFSIAILKAKIKALLRRSYNFTENSKLYYKDYELIDNVVKFDGNVVDLAPSESKILTILFKKAGQIIKKEELLQLLRETDEFIDSNTLAVKMARIRKKVAEIGLDEHIKTKRGIGYGLD